jgi:hypothetical protein
MPCTALPRSPRPTSSITAMAAHPSLEAALHRDRGASSAGRCRARACASANARSAPMRTSCPAHARTSARAVAGAGAGIACRVRGSVQPRSAATAARRCAAAGRSRRDAW